MKTVLGDLCKYGYSFLTGITEQLVRLKGRKSFLETFSDISQERICERTGEQIDVPPPHVMEEEAEVARLIPQEHSLQRTVDEIVEMLAPQIQEQSLEVIKVVPQE